jgi:Cu(I)-responsive transcriptional regulator
VNATAKTGFTIGRLARATGCKVQTIRFYEQIGLLPPPARSEGNQRLYTEADAERLCFVRHCRELGFSLDAIRELLTLADHPDRPCAAADRIAETHLRDVEQRIARLRALQTELQRMIAECRGGRIADCRIIEVLADHQHCLSEDHARVQRMGCSEGDGTPTYRSGAVSAPSRLETKAEMARKRERPSPSR